MTIEERKMWWCDKCAVMEVTKQEPKCPKCGGKTKESGFIANIR
jgi:Zn finger protein HypA/HybF involved in hydrogenase expression